MLLIWPHTYYAEDQPLSHFILTTHALHRGFQVGAFAGIMIGSVRSGLGLRSSSSQSTDHSQSQVQIPSFLNSRKRYERSPLTPNRMWFITAGGMLIRSIGVGGLLGTGVMGLMLSYQMVGAELIQWQDRSWRLLENAGQVEVDRWSTGGGLLGVGAVMLAGRHDLLPPWSSLTAASKNLNWKMVLGGAGGGSLLGVQGYLGWRYGLMNGKR